MVFFFLSPFGFTVRITQVEVILLEKKNAETSDGIQDVRLSFQKTKAFTVTS